MTKEDLGTLEVTISDMDDLTISDIADTVYSSKEQKLPVTIKNASDVTLKQDKDYELSYTEWTINGQTDEIVSAGFVVDDDDDDDGGNGGSGNRSHRSARTGDEDMPGLWIMLKITSSFLLAILVKLHKTNVKDKK